MNTNRFFESVVVGVGTTMFLLLFLAVTNTTAMELGSAGNPYALITPGGEVPIVLAREVGKSGGVGSSPQMFPGGTATKGGGHEEESTGGKSIRSLPGRTMSSPSSGEESTGGKSIGTIPSKRSGSPTGSVGSPAGSGTPTTGGETGSTESGPGKLGGGRKTPSGKSGTGEESPGGVSGQPDGQGNTSPGEGWTSATGKKCNWMTVQAPDGSELSGVLCCDPGKGTNCSFYY